MADHMIYIIYNITYTYLGIYIIKKEITSTQHHFAAVTRLAAAKRRMRFIGISRPSLGKPLTSLL